ncbi:MAG: exosortase/archaeosortase family protein [Verrucomicrobiota bacterium]
MNNKTLPYGLRPLEIGYLILLAAAFYYSDEKFRGSPWPIPLFGAAVIGGVAVLVGRCQEEWRTLPNKAFFFILAIAWVTLFLFYGNSNLGYVHSASLYAWLMDSYTAPGGDNQYGLMIPFVVLGLFWWKRKQLVAQPAGFWWPGILLLILGLLLHLGGFLVQQSQLSVVGLFTGLYGLMGLAWGRYWLKASLFPYFLLGFCIPTGGLQDGFTFQLRLLVSWMVAGVAHMGLSPDLIREGTQLFDGQHTFGYEVAAACSGIHSIVALLALLTIFGFVTFKSPWRRGTMMVAAIPLAVLGNVVRLCFTIGVAETFGQAAGKMVETKFGFVTFVVALSCAYVLARWLEKGELDSPKAKIAATST